jgi:phosphoribosylaminoimidazole-succinocarboxamide synthase
MCRDEVLLESKLSLPLVGRGKVRDMYDFGDSLLFVATDRISAFDCILGSGIPCKGRVLNQMSLFWFEFLRDVVPSHVVTADIKRYPKMAARRKTMRGRSMQVK